MEKELIISNFEKYGFTSNFEGEILKEVDGCYIGWVRNIKYYNNVLQLPTSMSWKKNGDTVIPTDNKYNLKPIEKI